jgi:hypothetical protein
MNGWAIVTEYCGRTSGSVTIVLTFCELTIGSRSFHDRLQPDPGSEWIDSMIDLK